jgi:hypothetical protein
MPCPLHHEKYYPGKKLLENSQIQIKIPGMGPTKSPIFHGHPSQAATSVLKSNCFKSVRNPSVSSYLMSK